MLPQTPNLPGTTTVAHNEIALNKYISVLFRASAWDSSVLDSLLTISVSTFLSHNTVLCSESRSCIDFQAFCSAAGGSCGTCAPTSAVTPPAVATTAGAGTTRRASCGQRNGDVPLSPLLLQVQQ